MTQYTFGQLETLWVQQGGNPQYAPMAAAVALAESSGYSDASNTNQGGSAPGSIDRGLWQINSYYHPSGSTFDPAANARAAIQISDNGTNWRPWCSAYSNNDCSGEYLGAGSNVLKHLPTGANTGTTPTGNANATPADLNIPNPWDPAHPFTLSNPFATLGQAFGGDAGPVIAAVMRFFFWVSAVVVGGFGMLVGIVFIVMSTRLVKGPISKYTGIGVSPDTKYAVYRSERERKKERAEDAAIPAPPAPKPAPEAALSRPRPLFQDTPAARQRRAVTEDANRAALQKKPRVRNLRRSVSQGQPYTGRHRGEA